MKNHDAKVPTQPQDSRGEVFRWTCKFTSDTVWTGDALSNTTASSERTLEHNFFYTNKDI